MNNQLDRGGNLKLSNYTIPYTSFVSAVTAVLSFIRILHYVLPVLNIGDNDVQHKARFEYDKFMPNPFHRFWSQQ